ncbi:uncharacterized protein ACB058_004536 isoform 1-T2 [Synchiropus picturatus]
MAQVRVAIREALWGMCAADAMSMPVHWYYDVRDITRDFGGPISKFENPPVSHPSSILKLSNTAGSGRTAWVSKSKSKQEVVGNVILHDKLHLWKQPGGSTHYHHGLQAGENTLNVLCALQAARTLVSGGFTDVSQAVARGAVLADYVAFMTTRGSHNDTYAESCHRAFFSDWQDTRPTTDTEVLQFAEQRSRRARSLPVPDSQLNAIGCLPSVLPFALLSASANEEKSVSAAVEFGNLTHPHPEVSNLVALYCRALHVVLGGGSVRMEAEHALKELGVWDTCRSFSRRAAKFPKSSPEALRVHQSAVSSLGLACYLEGALSSLFYLAYEFHDDPEGGILVNTNCGGENCNRGSGLGALLGAGGSYKGTFIPQKWKDEMRDAQELIAEIMKEQTTKL